MKNINWTTSDQLNIYAINFEIPNPKAVICLVHGLGEHLHRYDEMIAFYNKNNLAVVAFDRRGHGQSEGKRGHTSNGLTAFLDEIDHLLTKAKSLYPGIPVFLYGHSMGGGLVLKFRIDRQPVVNGVITSGAAIQPANEPSAFLMIMINLLSHIIPGYTQSNGLNYKLISSIPEEAEKYINDPLVHDKLSLATAKSILNTAKFLRNFNNQWQGPLLLMHGEKDRIVFARGSRDFADQVTGDVTYKEWKNSFHEIHYEANREEVFTYVVEWVNARI